MPRFARDRATALLLAALLATMPVLPLLLCLCSAPELSDGCVRETSGAAAWSDCCCDNSASQPAAPSATAVTGITISPVAFAEGSPTLFRPILPPALDGSASTRTRTQPLFKRFPAFLT